jgi:hypothetical protein
MRDVWAYELAGAQQSKVFSSFFSKKKTFFPLLSSRRRLGAGCKQKIMTTWSRVAAKHRKHNIHRPWLWLRSVLLEPAEKPRAAWVGDYAAPAEKSQHMVVAPQGDPDIWYSLDAAMG